MGVMIIVAGLGLMLLEVLCRLLDPMGISYYPDTARYMDSMIIEEPIGYRNASNLDDAPDARWLAPHDHQPGL